MQLEKHGGKIRKKHLDFPSHPQSRIIPPPDQGLGAWVMHSIGQKTGYRKTKEAGKQTKMIGPGAHLQGLL